MTLLKTLHPSKSIVDYVNFLLKRAKLGYAALKANYGDDGVLEIGAVGIGGRGRRLIASYTVGTDRSILLNALHLATQIGDAEPGSILLRQHADGVSLRPSRKAAVAHLCDSMDYEAHDTAAFNAFLAAEADAIRANELYALKPTLSRRTTTIKDVLALSSDRGAALLLERMGADVGNTTLEDMRDHATRVRPFRGLREPDAVLVRKVVADFVSLPTPDLDLIAQKYDDARNAKASLLSSLRPKAIRKRTKSKRTKVQTAPKNSFETVAAPVRAQKTVVLEPRVSAMTKPQPIPAKPKSEPIESQEVVPELGSLGDKEMIYPSHRIVAFANMLCERYSLPFTVRQAVMRGWEQFELKAERADGRTVNLMARAIVAQDFSLKIETLTDSNNTRYPAAQHMDYRLIPANRVVWDYLAKTFPHDPDRAILNHAQSFRGAMEYTVVNSRGSAVSMAPVVRTPSKPLTVRRTKDRHDAPESNARVR